MTFEIWNMIDGAPEYMINRAGVVKHQTGAQSQVRVRRTKIRGRRYANLIVKGKVKRFYIDPLIKEYFGKEAQT